MNALDGDTVNIEVDQMAYYAARLVEARARRRMRGTALQTAVF